MSEERPTPREVVDRIAERMTQPHTVGDAAAFEKADLAPHLEAVDATVRSIVHVQMTEPDPLRDVHPCQVGRHRPAYLNAGGIACGYCGVPL